VQEIRRNSPHQHTPLLDEGRTYRVGFLASRRSLRTCEVM
jgi:hypothetical protein